MNAKKFASVFLASSLLLPSFGMLAGCSGEEVTVLKVYNWEEYIDEGGKDSYVYDMLLDEGEDPDEDDAPPIIEDFETWYKDTYGEEVKVSYSTFGTNEDMYNELKLGNVYDLLCPSDYMIMKLANEVREDGTPYLEKYDESFFDPEREVNGEKINYYIRNVSPYIKKQFETNAGLETPEGEPRWSEYAAGYMWGTTGFVYNPEVRDKQGNPIDLGSLLEEKDWRIFIDSNVKGLITAKDNVRDTYFAALGVTYEEGENGLSALHEAFLSGELSQEEYTKEITRIFNRTDSETIDAVKPELMKIKENIHSFETDTGKADMVNGTIWLNYAWSGDAVYALNEAELGETDRNGNTVPGSELYLSYYVPEAGSNLWFDGWVMTKHVAEDPSGKTKQAAQAFVNFMSRPDNAMRNSYYIGYTSVISGENDEMLDYIDWLYGGEENEEDFYDLSYFFGREAGTVGVYADEEQRTSRQLYAQFPPQEVISRCAVMDYYRKDASERINELWSQVKAETLDTWAIVVICLVVVAIALFTVFVKFGGKIDLFRPKPKKGYHKV